MKTILILLLLTVHVFVNGQCHIRHDQKRIEAQQRISIPFLVMGAYFGYGIVHYAQPYDFNGKLNGSEECAFLALMTTAIGVTLNRIDFVIPFEFEFTIDPNPDHWDDIELLVSANFNRFKPHLAIGYAYANDFYNIQYGLGYGLTKGKFGLEPGIRIGTCGDLSLTSYLKESLQLKDFSIVLYQAFRSNSIGHYYENRVGVSIKI